MGQICGNCGTRIDPGGLFCSSCGAGIQAAAAFDGGAVIAGSAAGVTAAPPAAGLPDFLEYFKKFLRDPGQLVPILVLALFWLILSLLAAQRINPLPVKILSFLTFAQGGMYCGVWGAVGGIFGKAVFAYFFSALIMPLFSGKNPFRGMELKSLLSGLALQGLTAVAALFSGAGLALIVFNFFTGNGSPVNSAAGIVGLLLALKALFSRGDLLRNLALTAANKLSRGKTPTPLTVNRVIAGYGAGSALGVLLSFISYPYLAYILGALLLITGAVFTMVRPGKAVPV